MTHVSSFAVAACREAVEIRAGGPTPRQLEVTCAALRSQHEGVLESMIPKHWAGLSVDDPMVARHLFHD